MKVREIAKFGSRTLDILDRFDNLKGGKTNLFTASKGLFNLFSTRLHLFRPIREFLIETAYPNPRNFLFRSSWHQGGVSLFVSQENRCVFFLRKAFYAR